MQDYVIIINYLLQEYKREIHSLICIEYLFMFTLCHLLGKELSRWVHPIKLSQYDHISLI